MDCNHLWKVYHEEDVDSWTGWEVLIDTIYHLSCTRCYAEVRKDEYGVAKMRREGKLKEEY